MRGEVRDFKQATDVTDRCPLASPLATPTQPLLPSVYSSPNEQIELYPFALGLKLFCIALKTKGLSFALH